MGSSASVLKRIDAESSVSRRGVIPHQRVYGNLSPDVTTMSPRSCDGETVAPSVATVARRRKTECTQGEAYTGTLGLHVHMACVAHYYRLCGVRDQYE